jgi:nucleotide-binding universal stress UspA family protein
MIRSILVPTDFSEAADQALDYAIELAEKVGAKVTLLHVWQLSAYASPSSELAKGIEHDLSRDLEAVAAKKVARGVTIERALRCGVPYVEICEAATDLGADLIAMGTTGKTGLEHFLLGSVAERIVRTSKVPVLTVRHREDAKKR